MYFHKFTTKYVPTQINPQPLANFCFRLFTVLSVQFQLLQQPQHC